MLKSYLQFTKACKKYATINYSLYLLMKEIENDNSPTDYKIRSKAYNNLVDKADRLARKQLELEQSLELYTESLDK